MERASIAGQSTEFCGAPTGIKPRPDDGALKTVQLRTDADKGVLADAAKEPSTGKSSGQTGKSDLSKIQELGISGIYYMTGLAKELNVSWLCAVRLAALAKIKLVGRAQYTRAKVKEAAEKGLTDLETSHELKIGLTRVHTYARQLGLRIIKDEQENLSRLELKKLLKNLDPAHQERNKRILRGLSLREIARPESLTRECIRQYINECGLHGYWKKSRSWYEHKKAMPKRKTDENRTSLLAIVGARKNALFVSFNGTWAERKAIEYSLKFRPNQRYGITYDKLVKLFSVYDAARQRGEKKPFKEIGGDVGMPTSGIQRIFKRSNMPALCWTVSGRKRFSDEQKAILTRALASSPLTMNDAAFFTGTSESFIQGCLIGRSGKQRTIKTFGKGFSVGVRFLTYRLASQIYEAQDLGFKPDEVAELFDRPIKLVEYALKRRSTLQREIMRVLEKTYPKQNITKPYLPKYGI
jgi:hypothetical protein